MDKQTAKRVAPLFLALVATGCDSNKAANQSIMYRPEGMVIGAGDELGAETYIDYMEAEAAESKDSDSGSDISKTQQREVSSADDMNNVRIENGTNNIKKRGNHEERINSSREEVIGISSHNTSNTVIYRDYLNFFILGVLGIIAVIYVTELIIRETAPKE
tara:strand:+ start:2161 stop:2643 length:483 start_codon:yes stop_codon:yes gene_type:complete